MGEGSRGTQLSLKNITRSFEGREALLPISFSVAAGEFVSLLGPSGSGKTALLRLIAGLEIQDSGTIEVSSGSSALVARSFVFQDAALLPWRTVLENVVLPLELSRSGSEGKDLRGLDALAKVGLSEVAGLYPNQLSGGMKMRVSVARAIISRPSLLLLDEPFAALDERTRHRLQEDLRILWLSLGMTVVFVTHSASEAVFVSDRAIVLSSGPGQVVADRKINLGGVRAQSLRSDNRYLAEIANLNSALDEKPRPQQ